MKNDQVHVNCNNLKLKFANCITNPYISWVVVVVFLILLNIIIFWCVCVRYVTRKKKIKMGLLDDIINTKLTSSKKNISVDDDAQIKIEHFFYVLLCCRNEHINIERIIWNKIKRYRFLHKYSQYRCWDEEQKKARQ